MKQPNLGLTSPTTKALQAATSSDPDMITLCELIRTGWPQSKCEVPEVAMPYWPFRDELSLADGVVYRGLQVVVPPSQQSSMLAKIHSSHMGADSNYRLCRDIVFWRGMRSAVKDTCSSCGKCAAYGQEQPRESMLSTPIPEYPWQFVSQDLFKFERSNFLITVDHYSDYIEVDLLENTLSSTVIAKSKATFCG